MDWRAAFRQRSLCASWRIAVPKVTVELAVGDVLMIGNRTLTVIEIEGSEVHFRVDEGLPADALSLFPNEFSPRTFRLKAR